MIIWLIVAFLLGMATMAAGVVWALPTYTRTKQEQAIARWAASKD